MGEVADDMIDGTVCEVCGEFFDDVMDGAAPPGHTRTCELCKTMGEPAT